MPTSRPSPPAPPPLAPRYRRSSGRARDRRRNLATLLAVLALLAPLAAASLWVMANVDTSTTLSDDVAVEVRSGWGAAEIGDALQRADVINSSAVFQQVALSTGFTAFTAGRYDFIEGSSEREALDTLRGGPVTIVPDLELLLPPGLTIKQIAQRVGQLEGKSEARFLEAANSNVVRSKYEPEAVTSLEGLTWPDTYFIGANETETQILQKIVREFDTRADAIGLANAAQFGLGPYQAIISASLIQTEAGSAEDAPLISAVIVNRLRAGMLLQIDATLCYAKGGCPPVPVDADRRRESPYNTYQHAGLPPTPIATVGETALRASANPALVDYLFYVSDKNGKTYFASTQAEHERNVAHARNVE
jgi:UPF0755 protein